MTATELEPDSEMVEDCVTLALKKETSIYHMNEMQKKLLLFFYFNPPSKSPSLNLKMQSSASFKISNSTPLKHLTISQHLTSRSSTSPTFSGKLTSIILPRRF
ncbi:hypothetical protein TrVE_jg6574 [Triparma verrucosa]|uniref:Uncharacterized protein n=1 Tax=Triparma verrucosa TaxID=1606542 RepID=A0A9W7CA35_9STRA|nr:hypothetical protein TrVE_jg6574 [Triparma verrucosa]